MNVNFNIINQKGSPAFYQDLYADIPNPGFPGRIFIGTDNFNIYRDTGTTWDLISGGGAVNPTNLFIPYNNAGDFADSFLKCDIANNILYSSYTGSQLGLYIDFFNKAVFLGDYIGYSGGFASVFINYTPGSEILKFTCKNPILLDSAGSGNMTSTTAGGSSGKHLKITIDNVNYKIDLKNP